MNFSGRSKRTEGFSSHYWLNRILTCRENTASSMAIGDGQILRSWSNRAESNIVRFKSR